ncbi:hypothetical protein INT45_005264, partial [Circinella minor]
MSFSTRQCEKMGVPIHFSGLTVNKWSSVEDLALSIAQGTVPNRRVQPAITHTHLLELFQNISDHSQSTPALLVYETFIEKYEELENECKEKTLKKQFEQESRKNAYKGAIISSKRLGSTLDKEINKKSRHGNNINDQDNKEDNAEQADDTQASDNIEANDDETKDEEVPLDFTTKLLSITTEEAKNLQQKKRNGGELTREKEKIMKCGLSHLVDMVNASDKGQRKLFEVDEWEEFSEDMKKHYPTKVDPSLLTKRLLTSWKILVNLCAIENGFSKGQRFEGKILDVFDLVLNLLENHPNLFIPSKANKYTETDYLARLWAPLFDLLLSANFKDNEYNVAASELAKIFPNDVKLFGDECKLVHEGKDIVDSLVNVYNGESAGNDTIGWILQLTGPDESGHNIISSLQTLEDNHSPIAERFGRPSSLIAPCTETDWTCPTYYCHPLNTDEPIMDDAKQYPSHLESNHEKTIANEKCIDEQQYDGVPDEFGWVKIKGQLKCPDSLIFVDALRTIININNVPEQPIVLDSVVPTRRTHDEAFQQPAEQPPTVLQP